jgi:multidrug transporter EmrE-like cation transporter
MNFLFAIFASLCFATGGIFMKYANYFQGTANLKPALATYVFFLVGATFQMVIMREAELGVAYVVVLGLESLFAVLFGFLLFKESLSLAKATAIFLVVVGIALLHADVN